MVVKITTRDYFEEEMIYRINILFEFAQMVARYDFLKTWPSDSERLKPLKFTNFTEQLHVLVDQILYVENWIAGGITFINLFLVQALLISL